MSKTTGYVYAIGIEATTYVKIGRSSSPKARMASMQVSLPFKLELLYSLEVEHPAAVEQALHKVLADTRMRGEWFEMPETPLPALFDEAVRCAAIMPVRVEARSLSDKLRELLDQKGWSQQTLCKRAGIHHQHIYKVVSGETRNPRMSTLMRLARAFEISYNDLLDAVDDPQSEKDETSEVVAQKTKRAKAKAKAKGASHD